ncbi:MAG: tyrosine-type recombinase/integrase [Comamonadaceae bacterium]|nr:tyrosine-type recombinase/integrase [Comamonadaceae bacterium]
MTCTPTRATVAAAAAAAAAPEPHRAEFDQRYDAHLRHLRLKGLRPKTIEAYARGVRRMGEYFDHRIDALSSDQLSRYFSDLLDSHSWSSVKLDLYGYKFYTEHVLGRPWVSPTLVKAPKVQRLPDILTVEEAARLFAATRCLSYRVFFFTLYSMGLRLGEGLALRLGDIDAERMRVHVRDAKGRRDCLVPLPAASLAVLRRFWAVHRHPELLFPARAGGAVAAHRARGPLERGGVQRALARVAADIGLKKTSTPTACATAMQPT